jgi:hypothetical protein
LRRIRESLTDLREGKIALPAGAPKEWTVRARFWTLSRDFQLVYGLEVAFIGSPDRGERKRLDRVLSSRGSVIS